MCLSTRREAFHRLKARTSGFHWPLSRKLSKQLLTLSCWRSSCQNLPKTSSPWIYSNIKEVQTGAFPVSSRPCSLSMWQPSWFFPSLGLLRFERSHWPKEWTLSCCQLCFLFRFHWERWIPNEGSWGSVFQILDFVCHSLYIACWGIY